MEALCDHGLHGVKCSGPWSCLSEQLLVGCPGHSLLFVSLTFMRQKLCFSDGSLVRPFVPVTNMILFVLSLPLLFVDVGSWHLTFRS